MLEASDHNNFGQGGDIGDARKLEYATVAEMRGGEILRDMLRNIAERVRNPFPRSMPVVIFNPLSWTRNDIVSAHVSLYGDAAPGDIGDYKRGIRLVDETGAAVPFYVEQSSGTVSRALELVFVARDVPSLGYKTYFVAPAEHPPSFPNASEVKAGIDETKPMRILGAAQIENEFYRVTVDRATGAVTLFDKGLNRVVAKDMEIVGVEERGGDTLSKEYVTGRAVINAIGAVEIEENNPVKTVVRIVGDLAGVPVVQRVVLYRGLKRVDLENTVKWPGGKLIKIEQNIPYKHPDAAIEYGIPFGAVAGSDFMSKSEPRAGDEIANGFWKEWRQIQDWIFVGNSDWGLTIAADHQVVTVAPGIIRGGMLRGAYSSVAITRRERPVLRQFPPARTYIFHYSLSSHKGDWRSAGSYRSGMALNNALIPVSAADELSHKSLSPTNSFCSLDGANLVVSALKKSENGDELVLRLYDAAGVRGQTSVRLLGGKRRFREVNLLETDVGATGRDALPWAPFEIKTVKIAIHARSETGGQH